MHKTFEIITEIIGWVQILLSPTILGIALGWVIYYYFPTLAGLIFAILAVGIGLVLGIVLATKKFKTTGTIHFLSRISATPELENTEEVDIDKTKTKEN
jgi:hypothetical protein